MPVEGTLHKDTLVFYLLLQLVTYAILTISNTVSIKPGFMGDLGRVYFNKTDELSIFKFKMNSYRYSL